jgi:hypothetical protein
VQKQGGHDDEREPADPDKGRIRVPAAEEKRTKGDDGGDEARREPFESLSRGPHGR